jgi:hypothetical protein
MEKKDLKFYVTPEMEEQNVELQGFLCNSPGSGTSSDDIETDPWDDDTEG